jgi:hypothetical protein
MSADAHKVPVDVCLHAQVDFYTSNLRGAGTDATVFFQLVGDGGESEVQRVVAPKEAFERGGVDSFMYRWVPVVPGSALLALEA